MIVNDPLFEKIYNPALLNSLKERFGPFSHHHADLNASTEAMLEMLDKMRRKKRGRRAEVVMVMPDQAGHIWLHTKAFYPQGIYRLMTGGLKFNEAPVKALRREAVEETGFTTRVDRCLAVITYTLSGKRHSIPFASYVFLTAPVTGTPEPTDPDEKITDFRAISAGALLDTAHQLRSLEGKFADWGIFRAIAHDVAGQTLLQAATARRKKKGNA